MLYMPLETDELVTHGQLLMMYRIERGLEQRDISTMLGDSANSPWALSRIENNRTARPTPRRLRQLTNAMRLTYRQYTSLLRATDVEPSPQEVTAMRGQVTPLLTALSSPAFLADSRGTLWHANSAFERRFGPLTVPGSPPPMGATCSSFLALLVSRHSGLRKAFEPDEWQNLARTQLTRFWLTSRRLIQDAWGGRPEWLDAQLAQLSQLPEGDGKLFQELWHEVEQGETDSPTAPEGEFLPPGPAMPLPLRGATQPTLVLAVPLTDTRFAMRVVLEG
jgi:transcriptional regulator with XRE-family HTH domain